MMRRNRLEPYWICGMVLLIPPSVLGQQADRDRDAAQTEFRVETDVFVDKVEQPVIKTLTLFTDGPTFDFQFRAGEAEQITVFDLPRNRFVLLDVEEQTKKTVSVRQVLEACAHKNMAITPDFDLLYFSANPTFDSSYDEATGWLTLSAKPLTYRAKGAKPRDRGAVRRYQEFADWSARLNTTFGDGLPPRARIELDQRIAEQGWLPEQIERIIPDDGSLLGKTHTARTRHAVTWRLSKSDRKRIDQAGNHMAGFTEIGSASPNVTAAK